MHAHNAILQYWLTDERGKCRAAYDNLRASEQESFRIWAREQFRINPEKIFELILFLLTA